MPRPKPAARKRSKQDREVAKRQWIAFAIILVVSLSVIIAIALM